MISVIIVYDYNMMILYLIYDAMSFIIHLDVSLVMFVFIAKEKINSSHEALVEYLIVLGKHLAMDLVPCSKAIHVS